MALIVKLDPTSGKPLVVEVSHKMADFLATKSGRGMGVVREYAHQRVQIAGSAASETVLFWRMGVGKGRPTTVQMFGAAQPVDVSSLNITELKKQLRDEGLKVGGRKAELAARLAGHLTNKAHAAIKVALQAQGLEVVEFQGVYWNCSTTDKEGKIIPCPSFDALRKKNRPCKHIMAAAHILGVWDMQAWLALQPKTFRDTAYRLAEIERKSVCEAQGRRYVRARRIYRPEGAPPEMTEDNLREILNSMNVEVSPAALKAALAAASAA